MARYVYTSRRARGYGISNLVGDILLTILSGGLWLFWIIFRELTR